MADRKKWHTFHPGYMEYLIKNLVPDKVFYDNKLVESVDVVKLIKTGCIYSTKIHQGEIYGITDISSLIYAQHIEELQKVIDTDTSRPHAQLYFLELYLQGETLRAYEEVKKTNFYDLDLIPRAVALSVLFDDSEHAFQFLELQESKKMLGNIQPLIWLDCARAWDRIFNNSEKVKYCLQEAKKIALTFTHWIYCAYSWYELYTDDSTSRSYFKTAERKISNHIDYIHCADIWMEIFYDGDTTREWIQKAESEATNVQEWINCTSVWKKLFNNNSQVERCLNEAKNVADNLTECIEWASAWVNILCIREVDQKSLNKLERQPTKTGHWIAIAEVLRNLYNDNNQVWSYLDEAEKIANNFEEFSMCVHANKKFSYKESNITNYLQNIEKYALNTNDWIILAKLWKCMSNNSEAKRCLAKADEYAANLEELIICKKEEKEMFPDVEVPDHIKLHWHSLHAGFLDYLRENAVPDQVFCENVLVEYIDVHKLINNGCVRSFKLYYDKLYVITDLTSLIFSKNTEDLRKVVEALLQAGNRKYGFLLSYLQGDADKATAQLEEELMAKYITKYESPFNKKSTLDMSLLYVSYSVMLNRRHEARAMLNNRLTNNLYEAGYEIISNGIPLLTKLFDNFEHARNILKEYEAGNYFDNDYNDDDDIISCAVHWKKYLNDDYEALRCLSIAEDEELIIENWLRMAEIWKMLFNKDAESLRCIEMAKNESRWNDEIWKVAETWRKLFYDDDQVYQYLQMKFDREAINSTDKWLEYAKAWISLFNNEYEAYNCLKKAESEARDKNDWLDCAEIWEKILKDDSEAERCFEQSFNIPSPAPKQIERPLFSSDSISEPETYLQGIYDISEEDIQYLSQYIGIPFTNDRKIKKFKSLVGLKFGGDRNTPYLHFFYHIDSGNTLMFPQQEILKPNTKFGLHEYGHGVVLNISIENIFKVINTIFEQDKGYYLRITGEFKTL